MKTVMSDIREKIVEDMWKTSNKMIEAPPY